MKCTGISYSWYAFSLPRSKKLLRLQSTLSLMTLFVICTSTLSLMKSHTLLSSLIQIRTLVATLERSPGQPGLVFIICKPEILQQARTTAEVQSESSNRSNFRRNCPAKAVVHIRHSCRERLFQFSETSTSSSQEATCGGTNALLMGERISDQDIGLVNNQPHSSSSREATHAGGSFS
jgi:hypothetical protein